MRFAAQGGSEARRGLASCRAEQGGVFRVLGVRSQRPCSQEERRRDAAAPPTTAPRRGGGARSRRASRRQRGVVVEDGRRRGERLSCASRDGCSAVPRGGGGAQAQARPVCLKSMRFGPEAHGRCGGGGGGGGTPSGGDSELEGGVCVHKNARAPLARPFLCIRTHTYKRPQERTHTYTHIYSRARAHTHELKHTDKGVTCRQK